MAHTTQDTALLPDSSSQEAKEKVLEGGEGVVGVAGMKHVEDGSSTSVAVADPHVEKTTSQNSSDTLPNAPPPRPSLVPLGSSNPQGSGLTITASHPKKFNTVNISKKFLERNSSTSASATSTSHSSAAKSGTPVARPAAQPASSHSRLVTTKLTANPVVPTPAAGWSRPSSVTPSPATATSSPSSTSPLPGTTPIQTSTTVAPQLPHVGKVIQPQPRAAVPQPTLQHKDSASSKPVWRNVRPPNVAPTRSDAQTSDFPTAAEVANVNSSAPRKPNKADDAKAILDTAARQLRAEEADAFRGLHLGPNIHHWDEMEGDDDDFLGGVIEFGDGRQYKIESNDLPQETSSSLLSHSMTEGDLRDSPLSITKEDRFVDDFDRSWPRSRNSPAEVARDFPQSTSPSISPDISHPAQTLQDSSRVLFNERSNRLEPYSQSHRPGQGQFGAKRGGYQEASGSEPRGMRDGPHNVQVLQKSIGGEFASRSRRFSGGSAGFGPGPSNSFTDRHRDRDHPNRRDGPPPSPRLSRDHHQSQTDSGGRDWDFASDRGRRTTMGPPPNPPYAQKHPQEGRQLPPHLNQAPAHVHPRRISSRDSRLSSSEPPLSAGLPPNSARFPPQSPSVSHASLVLISPISGQNISLPLTAPELDEARKDVMQSAAARAKQRRQQEEEEREVQKERARKKALELEEKMKAAEADRAKQKEAEEAAVAKEKEALAVIEDATKAISPSTKPLGEIPSDPTKPPLRRPPSLKAVPRQPGAEPFRSAGLRRTSILSPLSAPLSASIPPVSLTSSASQIDSWRVKSNPPPQQQTQPRPSATPTFISPPPSALEQIESIADGAQDDLEIVDFSDMGKFVGASEAVEVISDSSPAVKINVGALSRPPRPVASDFFDEPSLSGKEGEFGAKRKVPQDSIAPLDVKAEIVEHSDVSNQTVLLQENDNGNDDQSSFLDGSFFTDTISTTSMTSSKEPLSHVDQEHGAQPVNVSLNLNSQRTPRSQAFYKEAAMSALDDAMSRIKGALVGMQVNEVPKDFSQTGPLGQESRAFAPPQGALKERWVPPALRSRNFDQGDEPQEVFLVTVIEPSKSVPPLGSSLVVRLPSVPRLPMEGINKRQLHLFSRPPPPPRLDILSFDPPIHDINRKDLSVNSVLFRIPVMSFKGRFKYRVVLPRSRGPKVHIPGSNLGKLPGVGAFGRPTISDGATTWRKSTLSPTKAEENMSLATGLSTMSRSPAPQDLPAEASSTSISMPKPNEDLSTKSDSAYTPIRSRSQPKMPIGSAVAFYRDSRIDVVDAVSKPLVNFIVGSELEDFEQTSDSPIQGRMDVTASPGDIEMNPRSSQPSVNGMASSPSTSLEQSLPSLVSKTESKSSDDSTDPILITPPQHHAVSWARSSVSLPIKDSPARAPDPEHLKAVWSQTSNKAGLHPVNSLEGIADDLTALPFTLQDVKSEDGETPPPSLPTAPSRMSLHEVTRAFQQVPTSSSTSTPPSHRTAISPPLTNAPVARPTTYSYSPLSQNNLRPPYPSYPSPMMNHSPAPAMYPHPMTPSPVPGRMQVNGHTPLYSQPMWVTMAVPTPQGHGAMIRPVASPYPGPMMYPSPGYIPQPALPVMPPPHTQNGNRGRGGPIMSPGMSHAHAHSPAMYAASPVLPHAMHVPQNHGFMPMPAGRGQPRTENGSSQQQHPPHNNHHPPSHTGFSSGANTSYVRPAW